MNRLIKHCFFAGLTSVLWISSPAVAELKQHKTGSKVVKSPVKLTVQFRKSGRLAQLATTAIIDHQFDDESTQQRYTEEADRAQVIAEADATSAADKKVLLNLANYYYLAEHFGVVKTGKDLDHGLAKFDALNRALKRGYTLPTDSPPADHGLTPEEKDALDLFLKCGNILSVQFSEGYDGKACFSPVP